MFTLIYHNGKFNRPDSLVPFLQSNIGESPFLQVDCITPYNGTKEKMTVELCTYLNKVVSGIDVTYNMIQNSSTESDANGDYVKYLVIQVHVLETKQSEYE